MPGTITSNYAIDKRFTASKKIIENTGLYGHIVDWAVSKFGLKDSIERSKLVEVGSCLTASIVKPNIIYESKNFKFGMFQSEIKKMREIKEKRDLYVNQNYRAQPKVEFNIKPVKFIRSIIKSEKRLISWLNNQSDKLIPKLNTGHQRNAVGSLTILVDSIIKRNYNVPDLNSTQSEDLVKVVFDKFEKCYFKGDKIDKVNCDSVNAFNEWFNTRVGEKKKQIDALYNTKLYNDQRYSSFVKANEKVLMEQQTLHAAANQIVAGSNVTFNLMYASAIKSITKAMLKNLKGKYNVFSDMTDKQFANWVGCNLLSKKRIKAIMIDFSKYDKAQKKLILDLNCMFLKKFGMSDLFIEHWFKTHHKTTLKFDDYGIDLNVIWQRKSGDPFTYLGNTITAMFMLCYVYDMDDIIAVSFSGDDSIMWVKSSYIVKDKSNEFANIFNMFSKLEVSDTSWVYCSRFICVVKGEVFILPNVIKSIIKLGRDDMMCKIHLDEYLRSLQDTFYMYKNLELVMTFVEEFQKYFTIFNNVNILYLTMQFLSLVYGEKDTLKTLFYGDLKTWNRPLIASQRFYDENSYFEKTDYLVENF